MQSQEPCRTIDEGLGGAITGGAYQWSPGDSAFAMIKGTELPYANGIEVSADEQEICIAISGRSRLPAIRAARNPV